MSINRAQRVDEKNGVICLAMFAVISMSKMTHFLYITVKNQSLFG